MPNLKILYVAKKLTPSTSLYEFRKCYGNARINVILMQAILIFMIDNSYIPYAKK